MRLWVQDPWGAIVTFFPKKACLYVDTFLSLAINLNIYINLFHCGGKTEMPTKMDNIAFCRFG